MKNNHIVLVCLAICALTGCRSNAYVFRSFEEALSKPAKELPYLDLTDQFGGLETALSVIPAGPVFFVHNSSDDTLLCEIRNREGRLLQRFARKGRGPQEFLGARIVDGSVEVRPGGVDFTLVDTRKGKLLSYRYELEENRLTVQKQDQLPEGLFPLRQMFRTAAGYFFVLQNGQLDIVTTDESFGNPIRHAYEGLKEELTPNERQLFQSWATMALDGSRIALSYFHLPRIDFLRPDGTTEKVCYYGKEMSLDEAAFDQFYFQRLAYAPDCLYAAYRGKDAGTGEEKWRTFKLTLEGTIVDAYDFPAGTLSYDDNMLYVLDNSEGPYYLSRFRRYILE